MHDQRAVRDQAPDAGQEAPPILIVREDRHPSNRATHDMIGRPLELHARGTAHTRTFSTIQFIRQDYVKCELGDVPRGVAHPRAESALLRNLTLEWCRPRLSACIQLRHFPLRSPPHLQRGLGNAHSCLLQSLSSLG